MNKIILTFIGFLMLAGCATPSTTPQSSTEVATLPAAPPSTSTFASTNTPAFTPIEFTPFPTTRSTSTPPVTVAFCSDPQVIALINSLKSSMLTSNGELLSSLLHPSRGMQVRWIRNGNVLTYSAEQAKFLYETTYEAEWGDEPGSGSPKLGSFHDVIVPELVEIFNQSYTLQCNDLKHGGATYELEFPYNGNFYSLFVAGTEKFGFLDWHTWAIGIDTVNGKPYIYAMMQFFWEP